MKLTNRMEWIEVYYDGRCGMCCSFHEWINRQPRAFKIVFIPYQAEKAEQVFPGIGSLDPSREMVVRTSDHELFRGAEAWVWCLNSCANHQRAAQKLSGPKLLPLAIRACRVLAANRHSLSKVFFYRKDKVVREKLHQMPAPDCKKGHCATQS